MPEFASFPFYSWRHAVVVPKGHPLSALHAPDLRQIGQYPIITYHEGFTGRSRVERAFAQAGIQPDIVMSALDADVIKSYVELGLGIGIIAPMAFDMDRDEGLEVIDSAVLFEENVTSIALRRGRVQRGFVYRFIELCKPELQRARVEQALAI